MTVRLRRLAPLAALIPAALAASGIAANEPPGLPQSPTGVAQSAAMAAEGGGRVVDADRREDGTTPAGDAAQQPASPLLQSLRARAAVAVEPAAGIVANPDEGVVFRCPRALLSALLAGAAETGDAVSALAIERETLALCRERQEIVTGIVTLEGELRALLAGPREVALAPVASEGSSIVKESAPVRVVRRLDASPAQAQPVEPAKADTPEPPAKSPAYSWFSIIGTEGDLRAGIGDGSRIWFVREGDRLPGGVTIERIGTRPPGIRIGGGGPAALPYRPRPQGAVPAAGAAGGDGP